MALNGMARPGPTRHALIRALFAGSNPVDDLNCLHRLNYSGYGEVPRSPLFGLPGPSRPDRRPKPARDWKAEAFWPDIR